MLLFDAQRHIIGRDTDNGGTELSVTQGAFPDKETRDMHQGGWNACLDNLEKLLTD